MKIDSQTLDPRRAGQVTRYHTWPRLREQSVGEHCWQLVRILYAIWPAVPAQIVRHAITHDIGEVVVGDMPYPSKRNSPEFKILFDKMESDAHLKMCQPWSLPPPDKLMPGDQAAFKLAEYIEMWEWGLDEMTLGNAAARLVAERCYTAAEEQIRKLIALDNSQHDGVLTNAPRYMARRAAYYKGVTGEEIPLPPLLNATAVTVSLTNRNKVLYGEALDDGA